jgi:hypothetical protein
MSTLSNLPNHLQQHLMKQASMHLNSKSVSSLSQVNKKTRNLLKNNVSRRKTIHKTLKETLKHIKIVEERINTAQRTWLGQISERLLGLFMPMTVGGYYRYRRTFDDAYSYFYTRVVSSLWHQTLYGVSDEEGPIARTIDGVHFRFDKKQNTLFSKVTLPSVTLIHKSKWTIKSRWSELAPMVERLMHDFQIQPQPNRWFVPIERSVIILDKNPNKSMPPAQAHTLVLALKDAGWPLPSGAPWNAIKANIQRRENNTKTSTIGELIKSLNPSYTRLSS